MTRFRAFRGMQSRISAELTAGLYCVAQPQGRSHFTSDRRTAHNNADDVRELLRKYGCAGVHQVGVQFLDGNQWLDCQLGR